MTAPVPLVSLLTAVDDPRRPQGQYHSLEAILLIATLAVICGADNGTEVEFFGHQKQAWLETFLELPHGIPSHDQARGVSPLHLVSAWADEARLVLGQRRVDSRFNASTAIPALLETLTLEGCIVTIDRVPPGWGCQKRMAQTIRDRGADYVLALKGNQPQLHEAVVETFAV
ncbi:MAG: ISAs1 family transposase, partial [Caldilineaceae bacterium]|nr:ISAs1 family transposase [Caldilineaceae bacterium]